MWYKLKRIMMRPNGVEKQVRPKWWWQPWADTVLYLPLDGDVVDYSSYARTITVYWAGASVGTPVFSNITWWKQVANFIATNPNNSNWFAFTENLTDIPTSWDMTLSFWMSWGGNTTNDYEHIIAYRNQNWFAWMSMISNNGNFLFHGSWQENTTFYPTTWTWYHIVCVVDNWTCNIYQDWSLIYTDSYTYWSGGNWLWIWAYPESFHTNGRYEPYNWLLSEVIIEKVAWSAQDVSDYYDLTKWDYGIS